jgi:hypothetical protein
LKAGLCNKSCAKGIGDGAFEPLNGDYFAPYLSAEYLAAHHWLAVDQYRACTAVTSVAADLCSSQSQTNPQQFRQRCEWKQLQIMRTAVYAKRNAQPVVIPLRSFRNVIHHTGRSALIRAASIVRCTNVDATANFQPLCFNGWQSPTHNELAFRIRSDVGMWEISERSTAAARIGIGAIPPSTTRTVFSDPFESIDSEEAAEQTANPPCDIEIFLKAVDLVK